MTKFNMKEIEITTTSNSTPWVSMTLTYIPTGAQVHGRTMSTEPVQHRLRERLVARLKEMVENT